MRGVVVTLKTNVVTDEAGNFVFDEEDNIRLHDENDVGMLVKTHVFPMSQLTPEGQLMSGYISRAEIYWDNRRNPSPDLVDPADLVWISFAEQETEEDDDQEDSDQDEEGYDERGAMRDVQDEVLDQ